MPIDPTAAQANMVRFAPVARLCREQVQYAYRYLDGRHGSPRLGEGLRYVADSENYHNTRIHVEDVLEFVTRYAASEVRLGAIDEAAGVAMIEAARTWTPNPRDFE